MHFFYSHFNEHKENDFFLSFSPSVLTWGHDDHDYLFIWGLYWMDYRPHLSIYVLDNIGIGRWGGRVARVAS